MTRRIAALVVMVLTAMVGMSTTAEAAVERGCVSRAEWLDAPFKPVDRRHWSPVIWTRRQAHEYFGVAPFRTSGPISQGVFFYGYPAVWFAQDYHGCWSTRSGGQRTITVEFIKVPAFVNMRRLKTIDAYAY